MMGTNVLFITCIIILVGFMIVGFLRGILGIVFGVVSWIFFFFFVSWVSPSVYTNLQGSAVETYVSEWVYDVVDEQAREKLPDEVDGAGSILAEELGAPVTDTIMVGISKLV
ncbi:MAG: hypothetical protein K6B14_04940, partial [Lachnospiraceae bacterium]|nr:hypothetical protein [Lachnospiraceae bacterium]